MGARLRIVLSGGLVTLLTCVLMACGWISGLDALGIDASVEAGSDASDAAPSDAVSTDASPPCEYEGGVPNCFGKTCPGLCCLHTAVTGSHDCTDACAPPSYRFACTAPSDCTETNLHECCFESVSIDKSKCPAAASPALQSTGTPETVCVGGGDCTGIGLNNFRLCVVDTDCVAPDTCHETTFDSFTFGACFQ
jgi:hypothetical protein